MARNMQPVSVWGIEFDALIDETKNMTSTIPEYPVEEGFPVSDTIINDPLSVSMTLYLTNTPVTWLYRHGTSNDRVNQICDMIQRKWFDKQLTKIVTSDTIYTNMGITSISIKKSTDTGYAREISISAKKVRVTKRKTVNIPHYILKAGATMAKAGKASTSKTSASSTASSSSSSGSSSGSGGSSSSKSKSNSKKSASILYGAASGLGLI
jgi:uncharacterized membrane protein YgcG